MGKKILIINPSSLFMATFSGDRFWDREHNFRASLLVLYSYLKERNFKSEIIDFEFEIGHPQNAEEIEQFKIQAHKRLESCNFDIVAISCYSSMNYLASIMVAKICRSLKKDCVIIVGGNHVTAAPGDFLGGGLFDFIVKGEGEVALFEICNGRYGFLPSSPRIIEGTPLDLSHGVFLDWAECPYTQRFIDRIGLSLSRGCPFRCSFCSESTIKMKAREYPVSLALQSINRAVDIMQPKFFNIYDPLFRLDMPWGEEIIRALIDQRFTKPLYIFTRVDILSERHIELLSKLNVHLWLGVETCSEKMLLVMNKTTNPKKYFAKVEENMNHLNERGVLCDMGLIFNHPGETLETVEETFSFLERMFSSQKQVSVEFIANDFYYLPGTLDSQRLDYFEKEYGAVIRHKEWWKIYGEQGFLSKDILPSRGLSGKIQWQDRFYRFWGEHIEPKIANEALLFRLWESNVSGMPSRSFIYAGAENNAE